MARPCPPVQCRLPSGPGKICGGHMKLVDQFGLKLSASDESAVGHFDAALSKVLSFQDNPVADLDRAIATDPGFLMASVLKALIFGLSTERSQVSDALALIAAVQRIGAGASSRETKHVAAVEAWLDGRFSDACDVW